MHGQWPPRWYWLSLYWLMLTLAHWPKRFWCIMSSMYSLVQWNWFSDITECTWVTCIHWRQRTNFTAPGCMLKTEKVKATWLTFESHCLFVGLLLADENSRPRWRNGDSRSSGLLWFPCQPAHALHRRSQSDDQSPRQTQEDCWH